MDTENDEFVELSREIRKIISENKKFLDRVMDDEFEPEEETEEEEAGTVVEL